MKAYENHINRTKDSPSENDDQRRLGKNGSPTPQLLNTTPNPRELKAYEKHIGSTRERLAKDNSLSPKNGPDARKKTKTESAYDRHMRRTNGRHSPEEEGPSSK